MKLIKEIIVLCVFLVVCHTNSNAQTYTINTLKEKCKFEKRDNYDIINLSDYECDYIGQDGAPMLPKRQVSYIVPINKKVVKVEIINIKEETLDGSYEIYPSQPPMISDNDNKLFIKPKLEFYGKNEFLPQNLIGGIETQNMAGTRICSFSFYPMKYNPVSKKISLISELKFRFVFEDDFREYISSQNLSDYSYNVLINNVNSTVENPNEFITNSTLKKRDDNKSAKAKSTTSKTGMMKAAIATPAILSIDQVIITNQALSAEFQEIADWKTKKGLPTKIVTTEWIEQNYDGLDLQEKIRKFISYAFTNWGTIWVLIGGDTNIVPIRSAWISHFQREDLLISNPNGEFIPTDMYYACLDGNWNADGDITFGESNYNRNNDGTIVYNGCGPQYIFDNNKDCVADIDQTDTKYDVFVGRIPIKNNTDLSLYKTKYFNYIKTPTNNKKNVLLFSANSDNIYSGSGMKNVESPFTAYCPNFTVTKNYECVVGVNQSNCATKQDVFNNINGTNGVNYHIICGDGHGSPGSFEACDAMVGKSEIDNLVNTNTDQIFYSNHCYTMAIDQDCIAEHYLNNSHGGIAYIGNTRFGWTTNAKLNNTPFIIALYKYKLGSIGETMFYQRRYGAANYDNLTRWTFFSLNFLGDPEMPIFTDNPQTLNVSVSPTATTLGEQTITVTIQNLPSDYGTPSIVNYQQTALICVQKGTEVYDSKVVTANGSYVMHITPDSSGPINVTVTAHNFTPFETSIMANQTTAPNLFVSDVVFDDDKIGNSIGNANGKNDAGETIELNLQVKNSGVNTANNVSATLSCNSTDVTILNNQATFGSITSGNTSTGQFVYSINKDALDKSINAASPVTFTLSIKDVNNVTFTDNFNIDIYNCQIEQGNKTIVSTNNGNLLAEAGETVTFNIDLTNINNGQATGLKAILYRDVTKDTNGYITSCSAVERLYPVLNKFETAKPTSVYQFTLSSAYPGGSTPLWFNLVLQNEYGKTWTFPFNLLDKPVKIETSNMSFIPNTNEIELIIKNPIVGAKGYNFYRSNSDANGNPSGSFEKVNKYIVTSSYFKDYNLTAKTKYFYKITAISSTGNESELSDHLLTWTSYPSKGSFPISIDLSIGNTRTPINVADVNNDGKKEIFVGTSGGSDMGYLIGLDYDGNELFNIDNLPSFSGYAKLGKQAWAIPAIGDLFKVGKSQIIEPTRNYQQDNNIFCYSADDLNPQDNKPDLVWNNLTPAKQYLKGAIMSNIDNSADGSLEIITCSDEYGSISIYNASGTLLKNIACTNTYGAISVADLDGDGVKEIIQASGTSINVWHPDGNPYKGSSPVIYTLPSTLSTYQLRSDVVICDIDGDGHKEIVTFAIDQGISGQTVFNAKLFAIKYDGSGTAPGFDGTQTISTNSNWTQALSVGDLNNDGNLEVVTFANDGIKVWSNTAQPIQSINSVTLSDITTAGTPLLADVDGDSNSEIIYSSNKTNNIYAYKIDGSNAFGFPIKSRSTTCGGLNISDVDNDGKNELMAASGDKIEMWQTNGLPSKIEWGSERHDQYNTGEYQTICNPTIITTNSTWNSNQSVCGDIIVKSGTLTIDNSSNITLGSSSMIIVMSGASLVVDSGHILNANVRAISGSNVTIKNSGSIVLRTNAEFYTEIGTIVDMQYGSIDK